MQQFNEGDLVSVQIPAKGEVGPIGLSGTIREVPANPQAGSILVKSSHSGDLHWYRREWLKLITKA